MSKIKTKYNKGDDVWIHGISPTNKLTKGKVITSLNLSEHGYSGIQYVIAINTGIDDLLEIRTWETMSQDSKGPVGALRDLLDLSEPVNKKLNQAGYTYSSEEDSVEEPTPEEIHAAVERTIKSQRHEDIIQKPKRRFNNRSKKS